MDSTKRAFLRTAGLALVGTMLPVPKPLEHLVERALGINLGSEAEARQRSRPSASTIIRRGFQETRETQGMADLETQINHFIGYLRDHGVMPASEQTSFYVYDINKDYVAASINIDEPRMAASLIKPFVMAAAYDKVARGGGAMPSAVRRNIRRMIQHSSNEATNRVIEFVGGVSAVQAYLDRTALFSATRIVETIPSGGRTYRNMTSAHDLNIFLNQLHHGTLVSGTASTAMLDILDGYHTSRIDERILPLRGVRNLAGKTGTVYGMNGEAAIVTYMNKAGQQRPFIFTAIFEDRTMSTSHHRDMSWAPRRSEIMRRVAELTVGYYGQDLVDHHRGSAERESRIAEQVRFYQGRGEFMASARARGQQYEPIVRQAARAQGISYEDLYSLLLVESGFQADVESPTGPVGIAQLTADTAQETGLRVTQHQDDRQDPSRAIHAAARRLRIYRDLFQERYTSSQSIARWDAIAAYQRGRAGMIRDLDAASEVSYWHLRDAPDETRAYVPRVLAVRQLVFGR